MKKVWIILISSTLFLLSTLPVMGAEPQTDKAKPEDLIKQRVEAMMQAKVDKKWDEVYTFYESAYRKTITQEKFANKRRGMLFKGFKVNDVELDPSGKEAVVHVSTDISARGFDFKGVKETQTWILEDNQWYMVVKSAKRGPFGGPMKKQAVKAAKPATTDAPKANSSEKAQ